MTRKEILEKTIDFDDAIHRIVRLEKENADLKKSCDETQELLDKQIEATYKLDKENAELKKENAELKTKVTALENANRAMVKELDDTTSGGLNILQNIVKNKEELTKAKFLLKQLVYAFPKSYSDVVKDTLEEAEQFLNSEVEK